MARENVFYNRYNTLVYALLFGAAAIYLVFPLLKRLDLDIDYRFFIGVAPYIFLGGAVRVLEDAAIYDTFLLVTPFIYLLMFGFVLSALLLSRILEGFGPEYYRTFSLLGLVSLGATIGLLRPALYPALQVAGVFAAALVLFYLILKALRPGLIAPGFFIPVAAHYFDASTSAVAVYLGAVEKHVLAGYFVSTMGPAGMFVMKTLVIVPVTYLIFTGTEGEKKRYYLFIVAMLGLALGTRNLLSMMAV